METLQSSSNMMSKRSSSTPTSSKASKKKRQYESFDDMESEEERQMANTAERQWMGDIEKSSDWPIHQGYLAYTLEDVALECDKKTLENWLKLFTPSAQPRSEEEHFYVRLMAKAIRQKLLEIPH